MSTTLRRKLLRDLWGQKLALATLVAIQAIGVSSFLATAETYRSLEGARERYYREYRLADMVVRAKRAPRWTIERVRAEPNVAAAHGRIRHVATVHLPGADEPLPGLALSLPVPRRPVQNDVLLRSGTWFADPDERAVLLNHRFARAHGIRLGDRLPVVLMDTRYRLRVVGTAESPEFVYLIPPTGGVAPDPAGYAVMYLPRGFLAQATRMEGAYNELLATAHRRRPRDLDACLERLEPTLEPYGLLTTERMSEQPSPMVLASELEQLLVTLTIYPTLFLGVAALVLHVVLGRLVARQRSVIGTLRALGHTRAGMVLHFLTHGAAVGALGGLLGIAGGHALHGPFVALYRTFFAMPGIEVLVAPDLWLLSLALAIGSGMAGAAQATWRAASLEPAEAMRPPPPEKGSPILLERVRVLWDRLDFQTHLVLRTIFRNPFRSTVSVLAAAVATALVFSTWSLFDSMSVLMTHQFEAVTHEDRRLTLRDPVALEAADELSRLPGVARVEPLLEVPADLRHGRWQKRTGIQGLVAGHRLYTPLDARGRRIRIPARGLVLDRKLAEILHAEVGDTLVARPLLGRRQETEVPVVAIATSYLGLAAYADLSWLSRRLGGRPVANVLLATDRAGADRRDFGREVMRRPRVVGITERRRAQALLQEVTGDMQQGTMLVIMAFAGLIAFGSILNTVLVSLSERSRQVATFRVLGYTPGQLAWAFSGECLLLSGVGVLLGLLGGRWLCFVLARAYDTEIFRFPVVLSPDKALYSALGMLVFVVLAELVVVWLLHRFDWLDALKVKE